MKNKYDGVIKIEPSPDQRDAVRFFFESGHRSAGVRHGTGKGKTVTALCIAAYALKKDLVDVVYIFHIKSAAPAFASDLKKFTRLKHKFVLEPSDYSKKEAIQLIQYNRAARVEDLIKKDPRRKMAICDEIQVLKSPSSATRAVFDRLRPDFSYVAGLTATPIANHIEDLYYITDYIRPGVFGTLWEYKNRFCNLKQRTIWKVITDKKTHRPKRARLRFYEIMGYKNLDLLSQCIDQVWHSAVSDIDVRFKMQKSQVNLLPAEEAVYYEVAQGMVDLEYREFVARLPALQKVVDESSTKLESVSRLVNYLTSQDRGVIVFFSIKHAMQLFADRLNADYRILTGDNTIQEREEIRAWFGPGKVVIMTAAGARSLNFHAGNQVVFYDIPFELEFVIQVIGRVARPLVSTFDHVDIYFPFVNGTIDEYRKELFAANSHLIQSVLTGGDPNLPTEFSAMRRSQIIKLRKSLLWRMDQSR